MLTVSIRTFVVPRAGFFWPRKFANSTIFTSDDTDLCKLRSAVASVAWASWLVGVVRSYCWGANIAVSFSSFAVRAIRYDRCTCGISSGSVVVTCSSNGRFMTPIGSSICYRLRIKLFIPFQLIGCFISVLSAYVSSWYYYCSSHKLCSILYAVTCIRYSPHSHL